MRLQVNTKIPILYFILSGFQGLGGRRGIEVTLLELENWVGCRRNIVEDRVGGGFGVSLKNLKIFEGRGNITVIG